MSSDDKRAGVRRTSREFERYDRVEKRQDYALSEGGRSEEFDEEYEIRTCARSANSPG